MRLLDYQLQISQALSDRTRLGESYRAVLEEILGSSTDATVISTSEHVAPFNRAHTVSFVWPQLGLQMAGMRAPFTVLILAGSIIPLDNSHYPRGFLLPKGAQPTWRFNLYPSSLNKAVPLLLSAANGDARDRSDRFFQAYSWLKPTLNGGGGFATLADQLAGCMEAISSRWFDGAASGRVRVRPLEAVARQVILRLIEDDDQVVHSILFDSKVRNEIKRRLHGVFCAWGDRQGSFLFWGSRDSRVVRLQEHEGCLVGSGDIRIPLQQSDLVQRLRDGQLWPGVFLSLMAVSYLPNLPISGGPKQLSYYRQMIEALNLTVREKRGRNLSQLGYMNFDPGGIYLRREENDHVPEFGTGLALSDRDLDTDFQLDQLRRTQVLEQPQADYRYE